MKFHWLAGNKNPVRFQEDPSYFYRAINPHLALCQAGIFSYLGHWRTVDVRSVSAGDVVIFHRPTDGWCWRRKMRQLERQGALLVAEVDDLIFDPDYAVFSPAVRNGILSERVIRRVFTANARALARFSRLVVSTDPLAHEARRCFPDAQVTVIPNRVPHPWLDIPLPSSAKPTQPSQEKWLTYFPGTRSHDRDFALVTEALRLVLGRHPQVGLSITGKLKGTLEDFPGRARKRDKVEFARYPAEIQRAWVNLAPLESTPFNRCKSAIKILEAAFFGIPTVCSPLADAERFHNCGALVAESSEDWMGYLNRCIDDPDFYRSVTADLSARTLARAHPSLSAKEWLETATHLSA